MLPAVWRVSRQIGAAGEKPTADANDGNKTLWAVLFISQRTAVMGIDLWRRQTANWKNRLLSWIIHGPFFFLIWLSSVSKLERTKGKMLLSLDKFSYTRTKFASQLFDFSERSLCHSIPNICLNRNSIQFSQCLTTQRKAGVPARIFYLNKTEFQVQTRELSREGYIKTQYPSPINKSRNVKRGHKNRAFSRLSLTLDETSPAMRIERGHKTSLGEIGLVVLPRAKAPTCAESNCDSLFEYFSVHSSVKLGRECSIFAEIIKLENYYAGITANAFNYCCVRMVFQPLSWINIRKSAEQCSRRLLYYFTLEKE